MVAFKATTSVRTSNPTRCISLAWNVRMISAPCSGEVGQEIYWISYHCVEELQRRAGNFSEYRPFPCRSSISESSNHEGLLTAQLNFSLLIGHVSFPRTKATRTTQHFVTWHIVFVSAQSVLSLTTDHKPQSVLQEAELQSLKGDFLRGEFVSVTSRPVI
jgi:hypothetical protein